VLESEHKLIVIEVNLDGCRGRWGSLLHYATPTMTVSGTANLSQSGTHGIFRPMHSRRIVRAERLAAPALRRAT
jgi:hypothetical protein